MSTDNTLGAAVEALTKSLAVADPAGTVEAPEEDALVTDLAKSLRGAIDLGNALVKGGQKQLDADEEEAPAPRGEEEPAGDDEEEMSDEEIRRGCGEAYDELTPDGRKSYAKRVFQKMRKALSEGAAADEKEPLEKGAGWSPPELPSAEATLDAIVGGTGDRLIEEHGNQDALPVLLAEPLLKSLVETVGALADQLGETEAHHRNEVAELRKSLSGVAQITTANARATAHMLVKSLGEDGTPINPAGRAIRAALGKSGVGTGGGPKAGGGVGLAGATERIQKAGISRGALQVRMTEMVQKGQLSAACLSQMTSQGPAAALASVTEETLTVLLGSD